MAVESMDIKKDMIVDSSFKQLFSKIAISLASASNLFSVISTRTEHGVPTVCVIWKGWWWDKDGREERHNYNVQWVENELHTTYKDM